MEPILGYLKVRGLGAMIRMLFYHVDVQFEEKDYPDLETWRSGDKIAMGQNELDFPNIPYLIDGDIKLTESMAIMEYLARKHDLDATTEEELIRMGLVKAVMWDYRYGMVKIAYPPECARNLLDVYETLRNEYEAQIPAKMAVVSKFLGNHAWVAGDRITYVDFIVYDVLDWIRVLYNPKYIEVDENLNAYMMRIEELPGVKKFMASEYYMRLPIFAAHGMWGEHKDWTPVETPSFLNFHLGSLLDQ